MLGQHDEVAHDVRQLAVALLVEVELDLVVVQRHRLGHIGIVAIVHRADLLQRVERPHDVLGSDRLAVMPFGVGVEPVGRRRIVVGIFERLGDQRIAGGRLVGRLLHQRLVEQPAAEFGEPRRRRAAHDEGVEAVERADGDVVERAALGRVRVHVVVALEFGLLGGRVDQRRCGEPAGGRCRGTAADKDERREAGATKRLTGVNWHFRPPRAWTSPGKIGHETRAETSLGRMVAAKQGSDTQKPGEPGIFVMVR